MRNNPHTKWSHGIGVFAWPKPNSSQEATLGLFYDNIEELQRDYQRTTRWQTEPCVRRSVSTLYLEKTTCGHAWLNIGARHYLKKRAYRGKSKTDPKYYEPLDQRIAVPIHHGGKNRRQIANRTKGCTYLWLLFSNYDRDDPNALTNAVGRLRSGCPSAALGTQPILLSGLSTLSKFHPTQGGRCL